MSTTLRDQYHDEHGRPLAVPEPSQTSRGSLTAWQHGVLARAAAKQETKSAAKELGPLHNQPDQAKARRRADLAAALAAPAVLAEPADAETIAAIDEAFSHPPPVPPPVAAAETTTSLTNHQITELIGMVEAAGLVVVKDGILSMAPPATMTREPELPPPPDPSTETERRMANLKAAEERIAARSAGRHAGALKAAATVRARREARETEARVNTLMNKSLDRIGQRVIATNRRAEHEAAEAIANPGIPTAAALVDLARTQNAEADLYRIAHANRAPHRPIEWSPAQRETIALQFNALIAQRQTRTTKGTRK